MSLDSAPDSFPSLLYEVVVCITFNVTRILWTAIFCCSSCFLHVSVFSLPNYFHVQQRILSSPVSHGIFSAVKFLKVASALFFNFKIWWFSYSAGGEGLKIHFYNRIKEHDYLNIRFSSPFIWRQEYYFVSWSYFLFCCIGNKVKI